MKTEQLLWTREEDWNTSPTDEFSQNAQLVLVFGSRSAMEKPGTLDQINELYPAASIVGCSTSGEIQGTEFMNGSLTTTALIFDNTQIQITQSQIEDPQQSFSVGEYLSQSLESENLSHVLIIADGLRVNGTHLIAGLQKHLPSHVQITGGLAGDGESFEKTLVCCDGPPLEGQIAAIGFYGSHLNVGYGSVSGWAPFGPERLITKSNGNILYKMDGQPAIDLYRSILMEESAELSAARFYFPLEIRAEGEKQGIVRTIVGINEEDQSLIFAGDVPEGYQARLMRVNLNRLMEGAAQAARGSIVSGNGSPDLALLVSCVGRKIVLKQRTFQELEAVREVLGSSTPMTGFYSYGELAPFSSGQECHLHNETMTITTFSETA